MTSALRVVEPSTSLDELCEQINATHAKITSSSADEFQRALECGDLLTAAKNSRDWAPGEWLGWLKDNVTVHPTTAYGYMRIARHRDKLEGFTGIDPALAYLSAKGVTPEAKTEMIRLRDEQKMTLEEIAKLFGIRKSTVHYHLSEKQRNRIKRLQRVQRQRADQALRREGNSVDIAKIKGPAADAYVLVRRAEQRVDRALLEDCTYERRQALLEALSRLYEAEDALVVASKLEGSA